MGCHNLIEPTSIMKIQMNTVSDIYHTYHHLLRMHPKDKATRLTKEFCLKTDSLSLEEQLARLEFLYMNDYHDEVKALIHSPHFNYEAAALYHVLLSRKQKLLTYQELSWLESLNFTHSSIQCLHYFTIVYGYYDLKQYAGFDKYMDLCIQAVHRINEPLFHYYMKLRLDEITFHHYWKMNQTLLARKYAYKFINKVISPSQLCKMNHHLALTHVFDSFDKAYEYARTALSIAKENNLVFAVASIENHTIPFICAFHQNTAGILSADPVETAHIAIAEGNLDEATERLSALDELTPFQETYLGIATLNKELLLHAHKRFKCELNDFFFARLPLEYEKRIKDYV